MPKNLDSYLADKTLTRQLYLLRFTAGEQKKVLAVLVDMRAELVAKLRAGDVTDFTRQRLQRLLTQAGDGIRPGFTAGGQRSPGRSKKMTDAFPGIEIRMVE
jgi:hypothetical protein